jgi:hypothetical protein
MMTSRLGSRLWALRMLTLLGKLPLQSPKSIEPAGFSADKQNFVDLFLLCLLHERTWQECAKLTGTRRELKRSIWAQKLDGAMGQSDASLDARVFDHEHGAVVVYGAYP